MQDRSELEADGQSLEYDFRLHDAYVAFSAEIVRLAVLAPVAASFLIAFAGDNAGRQALLDLFAPTLAMLRLSFLLLGCAIVFALLHRYFAADFLAEYVEQLRRQSTTTRLTRASRIARISIALAPTCLAAGWVLFSLVIFRVIGGR